jgi:hypothetical protein
MHVDIESDHVAELGESDVETAQALHRVRLEVVRDRIPLIGQRHAGGRGHSLAGPMRRLAWWLSERRLDRVVDKRAGGGGRRPGFFRCHSAGRRHLYI